MPQMARWPFMAATFGPPELRRQGRLAPFRPVLVSKPLPADAPWLIILNVCRLSNVASGFPRFPPVQHAISSGDSGWRIPSRCLRGIGRHTSLYHRQPSRRLRRRPVPGPRRQVRRACRAGLLPVTRFCSGHLLPPRRSRRDHRLGSQERRHQMWP